MPYERDNIAALTPYTPGEQPDATDVVKLNTNENPAPPAPRVLEAIAAVTPELLRRYPPPSATPFRESAASVHGLTPDHVIATNGGDELLRLVITAFCTPGGDQGPGGIGESYPTYSLYDVLARIHDTPVTRVPLEEDWALPEDFARQLNDAGCRLAFIVNPHAPSGRLTTLDRLECIARDFRGVLVVDEAYVDFAEQDALPLLAPGRGLDNVILLRSMSKGYSLAGLRFGYGLGHPELIHTLHKARDSYNVDILAQHAATAALGCRDHARESWQDVIVERARLADALRHRGWTVWPSQSNFILTRPPSGDARAIYEALAQRRIFVRYFDHDRLRDKLRITVGTTEQCDKLLVALEELIK